MTEVFSRAPFRLGLAGGGSDVRPYAFELEGAVVNVAINKYCYVSVKEHHETLFISKDLGFQETYTNSGTSQLPLHKGVHDYFSVLMNAPLSFQVTTLSEVPAGSGLGSSSAIVVALVSAYCNMLSLDWTEFKLAMVSIHIERELLGFSGGMQDQLASSFGGLNLLLFTRNEEIIVNKVPVSNIFSAQLEASSFLVSTNHSRQSSRIIDDQISRARNQDKEFLDKIRQLRDNAFSLQSHILQNDYNNFIDVIKKSWATKKQTSSLIMNPITTKLEADILSNGGHAFKVSGAGGGGFCQVYTDPSNKHDMIKKLSEIGYTSIEYSIELKGAKSWKKTS